MTLKREQLEQIARKHCPTGYTPDVVSAMEEAVALAVERCAQICEEHYTVEGIAQKCAAAIRAELGK